MYNLPPKLFFCVLLNVVIINNLITLCLQSRLFFSSSTRILALLALSLLLSVGIRSAQAWTAAPGSAPDSGNVSAPITTGDFQIKYGGLFLDPTSVVGFGVSKPSIFGVNVTGPNSGTYTVDNVEGGADQLMVDINGYLGAAGYCDANGNNCVSAPFGGGGGGWVDMDLNDTNDFDTTCEYRTNAYSDVYFYGEIIYPDVLVFEMSSGDAAQAIIQSTSKDKMYAAEEGDLLDTNGNRCSQITCRTTDIKKLQKRCGGSSSGSGGGPDADWTIKGNGDIYNNTGNVGIGVADPTAILDVRNPGSGTFQVSLISDIIGLHNGGDNQEFRFYKDNVGDPDYDNNPVAAALMTIKNNGNVGIGITNPLAKLHVQNDMIMVEETQAGKAAHLYLKNASHTWQIDSDDGPGAGAKGLRFDIASNDMADSGQTKMIIKTDGKVGIGTNQPSELLHVSGKVRATDFTTSSDINLKKDILSLENPLDKILGIRGVSFLWKDPEQSPDRQIGVIAQEVEKVFPELVSTDSEGLKSVSYTGLVAPLIEAVKEQQRQIEAQQAQISTLQTEVDALKAAQ